MPLSNYDEFFGGKKGSAKKAHDRMVQEYGAKEGERVFYATMNRNKGRGPSPLRRAMGRSARRATSTSGRKR